ncbi:Long-chain-fatty-acid--CoA ligase [Polaromonas sp. CG9_12]|nr:Long-chain-fatty-acid--CoA ligase [Polaromonas sp. CG9_12]
MNPVNLLSQPEQMRYVLAHSDCRVVCVAPEWEQRVSGMLTDVGRPVEIIVIDPDAATLPMQADTLSSVDTPAPAANAVALLMYTSGTTGTPKGVMLTQQNLVAMRLPSVVNTSCGLRTGCSRYCRSITSTLSW